MNNITGGNSMYREPIFLEPVFQERIWGGKKIKDEFHYDIPNDKTGEAWVISAHPHGPSVIRNGELAGKTLADAWENHGDLFNKDEKDNEYPLLVKILDANDDLSVQVHPSDDYARNIEKVPYGKTECWYVLSAEEDAELVLGHHAKTKEEFDKMVDNGEWDQLLRKVKVQVGDFFYVPSGTIHAIGKGIVILEIQQSSDITYRVYDYDRVGDDGQPRELHLDKAKEVTVIPHEDVHVEEVVNVYGDLQSRKLVENKYFTVHHWKLDGTTVMKLDVDFLQVSVINGNAEIVIEGKKFSVNKGTNFILPYGIDEYKIEGKAEFVVSHI